MTTHDSTKGHIRLHMKMQVALALELGATRTRKCVSVSPQTSVVSTPRVTWERGEVY